MNEQNEAGKETTAVSQKPASRNIIVWIVVGAVVLSIVLAGGWYFFLRKVHEGQACKQNSNCQTGLSCVQKVCSSGAKGSPCESKSDCTTSFCVGSKCSGGGAGEACANGKDCQTGLSCVLKVCSSGAKGSPCGSKGDCATSFCVSGTCSDGKAGEACVNYKDCQEGLLCLKTQCSAPPDYSKYFSKITVSKMKVGMPPGPDNIPVETTEFKTTDAIEIDLTTKSSDVTGTFYYDLVDATTGEIAFGGAGNKQQISGQGIGTGSDLPVPAGTYDVNIYFNDELVYTVTITVT